MIIKNAEVFQPEGFFKKDVIYIKDGRFCTEEEYFRNLQDSAGSSRAEDGEAYLDAEGLYAIPGLVDIHFHGCAGYDFCDGTVEAIQKIAEYELSCGITSIVPATMTYPEHVLEKIMQAAAAYPNTHGATLRGINMEGPFISPKKMGAQNPEYISRPDPEMFMRLQKAAGGLIRFCDIAPEEEGAMEFIEKVKEHVKVSLAHTAADYDIASEAFARGAGHVTHLYNAMPPYSHRAPGVIGAACDKEDVMVELICDGIHIHPAVVRTTFKMFGAERICLISDSMMATGLSDGTYALGGQAVEVRGNLATLADGTIAGSATNLMDCMRKAVQKMGIPLEMAIPCATRNPARAAGIDDLCGSIAPGKLADLLLLDKSLNIQKIIHLGK